MPTPPFSSADTPATVRDPFDSAGRILCRGGAALVLLLEAYENALDIRHDVWDFAVEYDSLQSAGLTNSDLRWLICKGYIEHAHEITLSGEDSRSFRMNRSPTFSRRSCFVLHDEGIPFAMTAFCQVASDSLAAKSYAEPRRHAGEVGAISLRVPTWDRDRQELRLGGKLIKQFKVPAANQEMILAAFEEEAWPPRIDDPLPPHPEQDSKRRLHNTINSLNRNQKNELIRFLGDGSGQGIRWELAERGHEPIAYDQPYQQFDLDGAEQL